MMILQFEEIIECIGYGEYFIKPDNLAGAEGSCHIKNKNDYISWKSSTLTLAIRIISYKNLTLIPLFHCELIVKPIQ